MTLSQVLFIRHGEEHDRPGISEDCAPDEQSLTVRGWQRGGALVGFFGGKSSPFRPGTLYTSAVATKSLSTRPGQTLSPLVSYLAGDPGFGFHNHFAKMRQRHWRETS